MHLVTKGKTEANVGEIPHFKCLKYLCLASKREVQWLIRGPYLNGTCKPYYTHIDKLAILQYTHISFELAHISAQFQGGI